MPNIALMGATYPDVPAVDLPIVGGGTARFTYGANPEAEDNDVIFIDYDGTIRYSYSASEFADLTELPPNPTHPGLTSQGWNWSLSDAKSYVAAHGMLVVGQSYITDDGKTRIYVLIPDNAASRHAIIRFGQSAANAVTVDWGDGSATESYTETAQTSRTHKYSAGGVYCITLTPASGTTFSFVGSGTTAAGAYNSIYGSRNTDANAKYRARIIAIELGSSISSIGQSTFWLCYCLRYITIPTYMTSWGSTGYNFCTCYALNSVTFPSGTTAILDYMFQYDMTLKRVSIPKSVTSIGTYAFGSCYGATKYSLPDNCTTLGAYCLQNLTAMTKITLPSNLQTLPTYALYQAFSIGELIFPSGLKTISQYAVANCYNLTKLTIPASCTSIQANAFANDYSLTEIHFLGTTPPTLANSNAFTGVPSTCKFYVPASALNTYKTASNWSTYSSRFNEEPT